MPTITFHNQPNTEVLQAQLTEDPHKECGVMQTPMAEVDMHPLPNAWQLSGSQANIQYQCMTLPCNHTFHPTVIALHFLTRNMMCPICRQGYKSKGIVQCIPETYRALFESRIEALSDHSSDTADTDEAFEQDYYEIDFGTLESELTLVLEAYTKQEQISVLKSRLALVQGSQFRTQHNFLRTLSTSLQKLDKHSNTIHLRFAIAHPLLPHNIYTPNFSVSTVTAPHAEHVFNFQMTEGNRFFNPTPQVGHIRVFKMHDIMHMDLMLNRDLIRSYLLRTIQVALEDSGLL